MDQQGHGQHPSLGVPANTQLPYPTMPYPPPQMGPSSGYTPGLMSVGPGSQPGGGSQMAQHQLAYQQIQQLQQQLQTFWSNQYQEIDKVTDFKNHSLPLARIKKIMKADEDVRMISAEAPIVFARACEMFILELTLRSWNHTEENKRRTLQKNDIAAAITRTDIFDFLVDIVPREDPKDELVGPAAVPRGPGGMPVIGGGAGDPMPYWNVPHQQGGPIGNPGMFIGKPLMDPATMYGQPYMPSSESSEQQQSSSEH